MDPFQDLTEAPDLTGQVMPLQGPSYRCTFAGPYSIVYKGKLQDGEVVAIKVLNAFRGAPLHTMQRKLRRERSTWGALKHPNILPLYGFADDEEFQPFGGLISPWLEQGDAEQFLEEHGDSLSLNDRMSLWMDVICGVEYLHTYEPLLVHGDLKPRNILIDDFGRARICDFGLVRIYAEGGSTGMTTTTGHGGTERYLAYELVLAGGDAVPTTASDIHAVGCIGLEFVLGQIPYSDRRSDSRGAIYLDIRGGIPPAEHIPTLLPHLEGLWGTLKTCWQLDPQVRPDVVKLRVWLEVEMKRLEVDTDTLAASDEPIEARLSSLEIREPPPPSPPPPKSHLDSVTNSPNPTSPPNGDPNTDLKHSGSQAALPPPLPATSKSFVMRKEPWDFIERVIMGDAEGSQGPRMLIVTGIAGCGKTEIILKFMRVYEQKFSSQFLIDGSSETRIRAEVVRHVRSLGAEHSHKTFEDCLLFLAQISSGRPRLLVYDNVDDPELELPPLLPGGGGCVIIVTSRNRSIGGLCPNAHLELDAMSIEEAVELLLYTPANSAQNAERDREEAGSIAHALGCLPIALVHAHSYLYNTGSSFEAYLEVFINNRDRLLAQPVKDRENMRYRSTYAAFEASFKTVPSHDQHFLLLLSNFHWSKFPLHLILLAAKFNFSDYECEYTKHGEQFRIGKAMLQTIFYRENRWDATNLDDIVASLQNCSLISVVLGRDTPLLNMHPLFHGWVKSRIPKDDRPRYKSAAVLLLALGARTEHTSVTHSLVSHVTHLSSVWSQLHINNAAAFGLILSHGGLFGDALLLRETVVAELRRRNDPAGKGLSTSLWSLANTCRDLGRLAEAEEHLIEVRGLMKGTLGERHLDTISAASHLGTVYHGLGKLGDARELQEEVWTLRKDILGEDHIDTVAASNNLAITYHELGLLEDALDRRERVLKLRTHMLGERHQDTINAAGNLAITYHAVGRLLEAQELREEVLKLTKETLGERHRDTITASSNLAATYTHLGRLTEAEMLQLDVLQLRKEILGTRHPDTIVASSNLATTYFNLGRYDEAEVIEDEVLKWRKENLGERHPDTIAASSNLAITYSHTGRLTQAELIRKEILKLREELYGEHHPQVTQEMLDLAEILERLGERTSAHDLLLRAKGIISNFLGKTHPQYASCETAMSRVKPLPSDTPARGGMGTLFPWSRKKTAGPITRSRTTAPSANRDFQPPPPPQRLAQSLSYRQLLQQRLQKYQWSSTFNVDCTGPQHAQLWKVSFFLGSTMIGESSWFTNKDAAKENAAMQALGWLNTYGYH